MSKPTQATRHIAIHSPLGTDELLLQKFSAREEISGLYKFDLDLLSENAEIKFDDIMGQNVSISMALPQGGMRYWNGIINRFKQSVSTSRRFAQYRATMVPWLWFLTLTSDCRIFQEKSVPEIIKQVFGDLGFSDIEDRLSPGYRIWPYCVQYRETHFNFISRLMEQEGIYYYFSHQKGKCTLVLCDSLSKHDPFDNYGEIPFTSDTKGTALQEHISEWAVVKQVLSGQYTHTDYNFEKPGASLMSTEQDRKQHAGAGYEIYDYPGEYPEKSDGDNYAKVRMEELAYDHEVCTGRSDSRGICPGYKFKMTKHTRANQDREYLILSADYQAAAQDYETSGGRDEAYACCFSVIPSAIQYRPERRTPKPVIRGTQTAVVTGPSGEEIHTNEYGQIKIQFHWDRQGQHDENSSCWVRVGQTWAGNRWGGLFIPRIGQEVIVDFLEGDPDQPIVIGTVYHGNNMPPYALPAEKTKSTLKSDSTKGGGGSNEIRFEDKKGSEEIFVHGQKDWTIAIENDKNQTIGHDETMSVGNNRTKTVVSDQSETVGNNKSITVVANHDEKVGVNKTETIGANKSLSVGANQTDTVTIAKAVTIGAAYQITVGAAMNETVGLAKAEEIGAVKAVIVGANSSEDVGGSKSVDARRNISEKAGRDVSIKSGKKMTLRAGDDYSVFGEEKGLIDIKKQLTIRVGKASITLKENGNILIKGKHIKTKGSGNCIMKANKILEN
jgi:type VI secretion system secreted protein VgrG